MKKTLLAVAISAALLTYPTAGAASPSEPPTIPVIPVSVDGIDTSAKLPTHGVNDVDGSIDGALATAREKLGARYNIAAWNDDLTELTLHVNDLPKPQEQKSIAGLFTSTPVRFVEDPFVRADLIEAAEAVIGTHVAGLPVMEAGPSNDSSTLEIHLEGNPAATRTLRAPSVLEGFPVDVTIGERPVAVSRNSDPNQPHWGGAKMSRPNPDAPTTQIIGCSTGFAVGFNTAAGVQTSMITADHCGPTNSQWRTGFSLTSVLLGTMRDTSATGTDIKRISGARSFGPVVYWGPAGSSDGLPIRGATTAVLNDVICYSGARSGSVCSNRITSLNRSVCYSLSECYRNHVFTDQTGNVPAAGQGDSGGPAIASRNNGQAFAQGIISGIQDATTRCTGEGNRLCSTRVIFAPVEGFFQANPSYGILVAG